MKVFISHKQEDSSIAQGIQMALKGYGVDTYLDLLDDTLIGNGKQLTEHIRAKMGECSDVFVVMSKNTKDSWWVPFEIGIASEKTIPIANYLVSSVSLPEYLDYWPRLKDGNDIYKYIMVRGRVSESYERTRVLFESVSSELKEMEVQEFYQELKKELNR
ncbi:toll/interleukin-1 receptor domain-containing protein [Ruminococcus sp. NK3A76]|uniref:toll/interleukin-1 receptor domain-containing protein n=1 Tax=Ruminococcus sp. NK3A76 TaxID=877411 RepID=UPI00048E26BC|nr:toll/interleukin-1 receptor domain-containing protein [Ruminococcus sp. NK3A76]